MRKFKILLIAVALMAFGCENTRKNEDDGNNQKPGKVSRKKENDERVLIVPSKSIGKVYLGQPVDEVGKLLGTPEAGDAAMGKAWGIWYDKSAMDKIEEFAIYSSYKDTTLTSKDVKQIRTASSKYETENGLGVSKTLEDIRKAYPSLQLLSTYRDTKTKDTIEMYDVKDAGIGFEFIKGKCTAVTVHPKDVAANATYLALHPEWKLVE